MSEQSTIELHGTLVLGDILRFNYFHFLRRTSVHMMLVVLLVLVPIVIWAGPDPVNSTRISVLTVVYGFLAFAITMMFGVMPYSAARKMFGTSYLRDPLVYTFTSEAIGTTGTGASSSVTWQILKHVRETKSLFLLYHAEVSAVIVPKRFFRSPEEMERWRRLMASCVDPKLIEKPGIASTFC